jgi:DNA ligase-1
MIAFAATCDAVAATAAKLEKVERLAAYFRTLTDDDLRAAARFLTGNPLAAHDDRKLAIGGRTIVAAAKAVYGFDDLVLGLAYRETGDLGEAIARVFGAPAAPSLFSETLTPARFGAMLDELADAGGKAAGKRREATTERALRACTTPREAAYVVKILVGDIRIGLREGLVLDAIAEAFAREGTAVRRAAMAASDAGAVAVAARADTLADLAVRYNAPIGFMLASPVTFGSSYRELADATWLVEDKFDGIRAQAHVRAGKVALYSRNFRDVARAFPDVVKALEATPGDAIFDGEIVARRDGIVLPFRYLQTRLQRVDPSQELIFEIPAQFVAFDILASGERFLLDEPLAQRRAELAESIATNEIVALAAWETLEPGATPDAIAERFEAARERGNEGLMLKRTDAPYVPGRRGKWWLKLKRELSTLDVVVTAVEWGHGKRSKVLSDYTFAVRTSATDDTLLPIGKAYTGLTDIEIADMTKWFLEHELGPRTGRHKIDVAPEIVIEIAFDVIQKSTLHASGFSLRFPRIVRLRPDKVASEIDTLENVQAIYEDMIARERVAQ